MPHMDAPPVGEMQIERHKRLRVICFMYLRNRHLSLFITSSRV